MDKIDKKIKDSLDMQPSEKYNSMINKTIEMIKEGKIEKENSNVVDFNKNRKSKLKKFFQNVAATVIIGALGITTYAAVTGKINIRKNTGYEKIDNNYNDVATSINKTISNEYCTLYLESMAADPAYLIFEYDIKLTDLAMQEIGGEVYYDKYYEEYGISIDSRTFVNDKDISEQYGESLNSIEKVSDNEFKIIEIYSIANIKSNNLHLSKKLDSLKVSCSSEITSELLLEQELDIPQLDIDIGQELTADISFEDNESNVLAESKLSNGSTLYIEEVSNSKFENYVLARIITEPQKKSELFDSTNEFMIEDLGFAICNQDNETISFSFYTLEEYYEQVLDDGSIVEYDDTTGNDDDLIRMQQVQLLRLNFDETDIPEKIKILPINRKLYNDRTDDEYNFYSNETWYQVKLGEINVSDDSQIGGSVTITKVEETDDEIIFYYDAEGYVSQTIDLVVRIKDSGMNYYYPLLEKVKGINGNENKIIYVKDTSYLAGMSLSDYDNLDDLDDLEFAIFYNVKYDVLSEALEFEWDCTEKDNAAKIENINFEEYVTMNSDDDSEDGF